MVILQHLNELTNLPLFDQEQLIITHFFLHAEEDLSFLGEKKLSVCKFLFFKNDNYNWIVAPFNGLSLKFSIK